MNSLVPRSVSYVFRRGVPRVIVRTLTNGAPRVRFAPSPTGFLHLGGLRTALYNYLFVASRGGSMVLRIEDTDQTRKVDGAMEALEENLEWAGLRCDEGPSQGGDYGPYVQSERLDIYKEHVEKLLQNGSAYRCFCTERRLDILRRDAQRARLVPRYDNRCRALSHADVKEKMDAGAEYCIRFKLTSKCLAFEDLIFGGIAYDVTLNEGDPVIMKSDGFPTYHFANVVDDHFMRITHVLRGVEWQISTTKHILLYKAFGWDPPKFGHLPLIVNPDGTKLSKRQGDVTVEDYRKKGILPLALVNYITLSGGGFDHIPGEGIRLQTLPDLAEEFCIQKISPHPSRLNPDLLNECNRLEIVRRLKHSDTSQALVHNVQNLVKTSYPNAHLQLTDDHVRTVLHWACPRLTKVEDLVSSDFAYLWILPDADYRIDEEKCRLLEKLVKELSSTPSFDENNVMELLRGFASAQNVKFPELTKLLRSVLSGLKEGPRVAEMMQILGRDVALQRISNAARAAR